MQLRSLVDRIESHVPHDEPLIIAGDFNDWRGRAERHLCHDLEVGELFVDLTGRHARSFPAWWPMITLDRIYYRGIDPMACACLHSGPWRALSDHAALTGMFRLQGACQETSK